MSYIAHISHTGLRAAPGMGMAWNDIYWHIVIKIMAGIFGIRTLCQVPYERFIEINSFNLHSNHILRVSLSFPSDAHGGAEV